MYLADCIHHGLPFCHLPEDHVGIGVLVQIPIVCKVDEELAGRIVFILRVVC